MGMVQPLRCLLGAGERCIILRDTRKEDSPMPSNLRSVVVDTRHSPHARLKPVPVSAVKLTDAFWARHAP